MRKPKSGYGLLALCFSLFVAGCANNRYISPVTTFHNSTAQTITTISGFYSSRNSYEAQMYLNDVAADPTLRVEAVDANNKPTPFGTPVFSPASIKARLDALALVGVYASRLYDLANTSAPDDFSTAATALGKNLTSLDTTFTNLGAAKDPTAGAYIGPISSLVGAIGKMYLSGKRDKLVHDAIVDGGPKVNLILSQLKEDMDQIFSLEIITGANAELSTAVLAYNNADRTKWTYEQRVAKLATIKAASDAASIATASAPSQLVSSMMAANNALLQSASASKKDKQLTLASLNDALSSWTNQIQTLATQIKPLIK
jgi:hypothetical protein